MSAKGKGSAHGEGTAAYAQIHSILDDRLQTEQQLSAVYAPVDCAATTATSDFCCILILQSLTMGGGGVCLECWCGGLRRCYWTELPQNASSGWTNGGLHTLRMIISLGILIVEALLMVLLVVFGAPSQVPTILGLATAGLTVVFQDFILAFFGWFVLMGRNGIRVGDWVEINGVGGEVVEITGCSGRRCWRRGTMDGQGASDGAAGYVHQ